MKCGRGVLEELFVQMSKVGMLLESIINDCLGLPTNLLKELNDDRSWDFMVALRYLPASDGENNGIGEHQDANSVTLVIQDGVGGLQVRKNGEWIPVVPAEGTIVVNVGDVLQVTIYVFKCTKFWSIVCIFLTSFLTSQDFSLAEKMNQSTHVFLSKY